MNPFDNLQAVVFDAVNTLFGQDASWVPSAGGATVTGKMLFQEPSVEMTIARADFMPPGPSAEFYATEFPGLLEAVKAGSDEHIVISGVSYYVVTVDALADGKTHKATLERSRV